MKEAALVSVIIPAYNAEKYVESAVRSIMTQTYKNLEILVTDDCSTDSTLEILNRLAKEDCRIIVYHNEQNKGIVKTLNDLVSRANGKYIARMDADDISLPKRIEKQVAYMQKHINIMILGCNVTHIDGFGNSIFRPIIPCTSVMVKNMRYFRTCFYHPTVMFRAEIKNEYFYEDKYQYAEDYALWLKILESHRGNNLKQRLLLYRIHGEQISQQKTEKQISVFLKIFQEYNFGIIKKQEIEVYARYIAANEIVNTRILLNLLIRFFEKKKIILSPLLFLTLLHKFIKAKKC